MLWTEESSLQEQPILTAAEIRACDCGRGSSMGKTWGRLLLFLYMWKNILLGFRQLYWNIWEEMSNSYIRKQMKKETF